MIAFVSAIVSGPLPLPHGGGEAGQPQNQCLRLAWLRVVSSMGQELEQPKQREILGPERQTESNLHRTAECGRGQMGSLRPVFGASTLKGSRLESRSREQEPHYAA